MITKQLLVYESSLLEEKVCSYLINFFELKSYNCKYKNFKNFNPSEYDNTVIYFYISPLFIDKLFELLIKESKNVFNGYVIVIPKRDNFLDDSLLSIDTECLIKKANYYGLTISCLELSEKNVLFFEDFFFIYDEVQKLENNYVYNTSKKYLNYDKNIEKKAFRFNNFVKMSAKNVQYFSKTKFNIVFSSNNIKINSLLSKENIKKSYIPSFTYNILQNYAFIRDERDLFLNHYFDKIYVLYLPRRENKTLNELHKHGIWNYILYEGFDGNKSPIIDKEYHEYLQHKPSIEETKVTTNRRGIGSVGSWAILKSMHNMLIDAKNKGYQRILLLQDDTIFHKNFYEVFREKIKNIDDQNWKLLYLGASQHEWSSVNTVHSYYHPCGTTDGAFAVGIHCSVFDELLHEIAKFNMPFDSGPLWTIQKRYHEQCYVLYKNIIIADLRSSDLRKSRDMQSFSQRFKWNLDNYELKNQ